MAQHGRIYDRGSWSVAANAATPAAPSRRERLGATVLVLEARPPRQCVAGK